MKVKGLFWILTGLLLTILGVITYYVFYNLSSALFFLVEGLILITILYLFLFYRRIIKPLDIIGNGMELLKEGFQFPSEPRRTEGSRPYRGYFQ